MQSNHILIKWVYISLYSICDTPTMAITECMHLWNRYICTLALYSYLSSTEVAWQLKPLFYKQLGLYKLLFAQSSPPFTFTTLWASTRETDDLTTLILNKLTAKQNYININRNTSLKTKVILYTGKWCSLIKQQRTLWYNSSCTMDWPWLLAYPNQNFSCSYSTLTNIEWVPTTVTMLDTDTKHTVFTQSSALQGCPPQECRVKAAREWISQRTNNTVQVTSVISLCNIHHCACLPVRTSGFYGLLPIIEHIKMNKTIKTSHLVTGSDMNTQQHSSSTYDKIQTISWYKKLEGSAP